MHSLLLALLSSAAPPSPGSFSGTSFYAETFVDALPDKALAQGWPSLEFPSRGVVVTRDGEVERFTFSTKRDASGFVLTVKTPDGKTQLRYWRWLDEDRAVTDLWAGDARIASRRKPTPADRRDRFGEGLAARQLRGAFHDKKGLVFSVQPDGGVKWGPAGRGTFFDCSTECTMDAGTFLCLGFDSSRREYLFQSGDAGVVANRVSQYDLCGAREFVPGEQLEQRHPIGR